MVLWLLVLSSSAVSPAAAAAWSCCDPPPDLRLIGPPPKPPWIEYDLQCNGTGVIVVNDTRKVAGAEASTAFTPGYYTNPDRPPPTTQAPVPPYTDSSEVTTADSPEVTTTRADAHVTPPALTTTAESQSSQPVGTASEEEATEPPGGPAASSAIAGTPEGVLVIGVLVGLMALALMLAAIIFVRYRKKFKQSRRTGSEQRKWFQIKPDCHPAEDEENYLYNFRVIGRIWKKDDDEPKEKKKRKKPKTCNSHSTCGLLERTSSASSSSLDAGYGGDTLEKPPLPMQSLGINEEPGDSSNTSGIGMSQSDLQMDSGDGGGGDSAKSGYRASHPHRTSLSEPLGGDGLPILTPIQQPAAPMLTALYERGAIALEDPATWHTGLSDGNKPDQNDHRSNHQAEGSPETGGKKKRKKRRSQSKLGLVQRQDSVAMETIPPRRSAAKYEPAPLLMSSGESHA